MSAILLLLSSAMVRGEDAATLDTDELEVLGAALEQTRHPDPTGWLLIDSHTAVFPCDPAETRVINLDGCSGMARPGQDPGEMLALVKEAIPGIDDQVITELRARSNASIIISKPLSISTKQVIWSPTEPAGFPNDLGKPEAALNLSRVGFDAGRTKALLYIGLISYTERGHSYGEYVYLVKTNGTWTVQGTMQAWKMGQ